MSNFVKRKRLTYIGKNCNINKKRGGINIKKPNSVQNWLPYEEVLDNRYCKIKR